MSEAISATYDVSGRRTLSPAMAVPAAHPAPPLHGLPREIVAQKPDQFRRGNGSEACCDDLQRIRDRDAGTLEAIIDTQNSCHITIKITTYPR